MNDPKLTASLNQFIENKQKLIDTFSKLVAVFQFYNTPEDKALSFKLKTLIFLNNRISWIIATIETHITELVDEIDLDEDEANAIKEMQKIIINNTSNSNHAEGENLKP